MPRTSTTATFVSTSVTDQSRQEFQPRSASEVHFEPAQTPSRVDESMQNARVTYRTATLTSDGRMAVIDVNVPEMRRQEVRGRIKVLLES